MVVRIDSTGSSVTDADVAAAVAAHSADTTGVHGISDTASVYRAGGTDVQVEDGGTGASSPAAARTNLELGTAATTAASDYDPAGSAAAAQAAAIAASQPVDSDLTAIAALTTTAYGRGFLALGDAVAGRTALSLGTAATTDATAYDAAGTAAGAVATHAADTTAVHGIADTAVLIADVNDHAGRLDAVESAIESGAGEPGPAGATAYLYGLDDPAAAVTGDVYGFDYFDVAQTIQGAVTAIHRGVSSSGQAVYDVEVASTPAGPWSSIWSDAADKPVVAAGAYAGTSAAPTTTSIPAGGAMRAKCVTAPTAGGSLTWIDEATGTTGTGTSSSFPIPIPATYASGDQLVCLFWTPVSSITAPAGWSALGAPLPFGTDTNAMYLHILTKIAASTESVVNISQAANASVAVTFATRSGALRTPVAGDFVLNTATGQTSQATPSRTTTVNDSFVVHVAGWRTTSTSSPGNDLSAGATWTGVTEDADVSTTRGAAANWNLSIAHETLATAGATTARTVAVAQASRSVIATLVVEPTAGSAPTGPIVKVYARPAA